MTRIKKPTKIECKSGFQLDLQESSNEGWSYRVSKDVAVQVSLWGARRDSRSTGSIKTRRRGKSQGGSWRRARAEHAQVYPLTPKMDPRGHPKSPKWRSKGNPTRPECFPMVPLRPPRPSRRWQTTPDKTGNANSVSKFTKHRSAQPRMQATTCGSMGWWGHTVA